VTKKLPLVLPSFDWSNDGDGPYRKWVWTFHGEIEDVSQALYDLLDEDDSAAEAIRGALDESEKYYSFSVECAEQLGANSGYMVDILEKIAGEMLEEIAAARTRLGLPATGLHPLGQTQGSSADEEDPAVPVDDAAVPVVDEEKRARYGAYLLELLCADDEDKAVLAGLMDRFIDGEDASDTMTLSFYCEDDRDDVSEVLFAAPCKGVDDDVPADTSALTRVHNCISWDVMGAGPYGLNGVFNGKINSGGWEWDALEEAEDENANFISSVKEAGLELKDVVSPLSYGQNWVIYHPSESVAPGQPALYFVSHGDCVAKRLPGEFTLKKALLRTMSDYFTGSDHMAPCY
jgi:hypothetical protein